MWREYGEGLAGSAEAAAAIDERLVCGVDANDVGQTLVEPLFGDIRPMSVSGVIAALNPSWDEALDPEEEDERFARAVALARGMLERELAGAAAFDRARELVAAAIRRAEDPRVIELDSNMPWREAVVTNAPEALYVVYPKSDGWGSQAVPTRARLVREPAQLPRRLARAQRRRARGGDRRRRRDLLPRRRLLRVGGLARGDRRARRRLDRGRRVVRILFAFAGGQGHFDPLVPLARAAAAAGHDVAVTGRADMLEAIRERGFEAIESPGTAPDPAKRMPLAAYDPGDEERALREWYAGELASRRDAALRRARGAWGADAIVRDEADFGARVGGRARSASRARACSWSWRGSCAWRRRRDAGARMPAAAAELVLSPFPPALRADAGRVRVPRRRSAARPTATRST